MNYFDANIHLPLKRAADQGGIAFNEQAVDPVALRRLYKEHRPALRAHFRGGNIMLFNEGFPFLAGADALIEEMRNDWKGLGITQVVNPRHRDPAALIGRCKEMGCSGIKFHSYVQEIEEADFDGAVALAQEAQRQGLLIGIDTSYGSEMMYRCNNMALSCEIARHVRDVPVMLLHSGGLKIYEAMLLAMSRDNVFLETSFSLNFYENTAFLQNFIDVFRKLGASRLIYGSDFPYVTIKNSLRAAQIVFEHTGFSSDEQEQVYYKNAVELFL